MTAEQRSSEQVSARLAQHLTPLDARLRAPALSALSARLVALTDGQLDSDWSLVQALVAAATEAMNRVDELGRQARELTERYEAAGSEAARATIVREQLAGSEPDRTRLVRDLRAMRRHLDLDVLLERSAEQVSIELDRVELAYRAATRLLAKTAEPSARGPDPEPLVRQAFEHVKGSSVEVVAVEALRFLRAALARHPVGERLPLLGAERFRTLARYAADPQRGAWIQVAALELCVAAEPGRVNEIVAARLRNRAGKDGMIVRYHALGLLRDAAGDVKTRCTTARLALDDPSEHVRQGLATLLAEWATPGAIETLAGLCLNPGPASVRGHALREFARRVSAGSEVLRALEAVLVTFLQQLEREPLPRASFVLLDIVLEIIRDLACGPLAPLEPSSVVLRLSALIASTHLTPGQAERVSTLLLTLEVRGNRKLEELRQTFEKALRGLEEGERVLVELPPETPREAIEKALAVETLDDFPVSLRDRGGGRYVLGLGERRRFRLWRLLHELKTPAPDKRMGYAHSQARYREAELSVAPARLGEVTPTRVPGERHLHHELGTWAQFLPRVDDLLAVSGLPAARRRIVTAVGTLTVTGAGTLLARLRAWTILTLRYARFADLREVSLSAREPEVRLAYTAELRRLGFRVTLENTSGTIGELSYNRRPRAVEPYFAAGLLPPFELGRTLKELGYALASPRLTTAFHLALVVWLVLAGMLFRAAWIRRRIAKNLALIPLRIGGWGSRGKSGSERIKAALFHALRFDVVVKTTGCEAMLIHARRDREARELFLYRPYDKATIWEQEKVVGFGARLGAQVFLWECMALQPRFVGILMKEWMQEEIATLTNAYPDHEDIMGPGGEDVARVIGTFMPEQGVVFTAEEQMLPLIRDAARRRGSELVCVSPIDAALLPADLLARFPYNEHPSNIAMVLALGAHLGVDREWALVKMGDHVVADLGVLKTYPTVEFAGRRLTFSNGMSANERAGFLSNWTRLGYGELDPDAQPDTCSVVVVNNRADRVPRSHVFAQVVARDAICEHIVLIGTNLVAMRRFIVEQFDGWLEAVSLGDVGDVEGGVGRALTTLERVHVSHRMETLERRLSLALASTGLSLDEATARVKDSKLSERLSTPAEAAGLASELLGGYAEPPDTAPGTLPAATDVKAHLERLCRHHAGATSVLAEVRAGLERGDSAAAHAALSRFLRGIWQERIIVVEDSSATGDQVIERIAKSVAPGLSARVLGCQNIKGTGLDFAYRWVSIGDVDGALTRLESEPQKREAALRWLRSHGDYGLCDARLALSRVRALLERSEPEWGPLKGELSALVQHLTRVEAARAARLGGAPTRSRFARVLDAVEPMVDHLDSVRRSRRAERVMRDLFDRRVSQSRAAVLLRDLVSRGKGGWLAKDWLGKGA
jgi:gamma-polyglutamate synthase